MLDLRKAYPRVSRSALWGILRRYGFRGNFLNTIMDLYETTEYRVREGESEPWVPERGLKEGGPTSPVLFNIFHQALMRLAERKRDEERENQQNPVGVRWRWLPGSNIPGEGREKYNSEAISEEVESAILFDCGTRTWYQKDIKYLQRCIDRCYRHIWANG